MFAGLTEEILLTESAPVENTAHLPKDEKDAVHIHTVDEIIGQISQQEIVNSASAKETNLELEGQPQFHGIENERDNHRVSFEPEEDICGMFDEGETDINLPPSILEMQRKKNASSWARHGDIAGKKHVSQKEKKQEIQVIRLIY